MCIRDRRNLDGLAVTRLTIAHRLSSVRQADRLLVLEEGRLVEAGSHEELIGLGGVYSRLLQEQFSPTLQSVRPGQEAIFL